MNCTVLQRRLLSAEQPDQPEADLAGHLAQCSSCRDWLRRLTRIEQRIRQLPMPPSTAKAELLRRLQGEPSRETIEHPIADLSHVWRPSFGAGAKERGLRKVSVAFALAASLLVFALSWWTWPHSTVTVPNRESIDGTRLEQRLATVMHANTPAERVRNLVHLAKDVHREARAMPEHSARIEQWARFYSRIVRDELVEQARHLPRTDRPNVLREIAQGLSQIESEASRWSVELKPRAPRAAASFERIARSSKESERELLMLLNT